MKCGFLSVKEKEALGRSEVTARENQGVKIGISHLVMMENAGNAIARFIADKYSSKTNVLIIAGTGNNGGDAFVAARHLAFWTNYAVTVALIGQESNIHTNEALINWKILKNISSIEKIEIESSKDTALLKRPTRKADVIVAAIFGTGFTGKPRNLQEKTIDMINSSDAMKISVDVPSGMESDTGAYETAVLTDYTITMDSPKIGMLASRKSIKVCGKILVANIGVPG